MKNIDLKEFISAMDALEEEKGISKDYILEALEEALNTACSAPYEIVMKTKEACEIIVRLETIGSRLAISDGGVAATMLQTAAKGAAMNVYINTKLMKNRSRAEDLNKETFKAVEEVDSKCAAVYEAVKNSLTGGDNK